MTEPQKFERKHFFIDRKLQGRYMVSFLVPMLTMLLFMLITLYVAANSLIATTTDIIRDDLSNIKKDYFVDITEPTVTLYEKIVKKTDSYLREYSESEKYRNIVMSKLMLVFGIGIFVIIVQIVLLTIFYSHKLAGPVYRFEMFCHRILDNDYTDRIHLRKGDEMQNLAGLLNETNEKNSDLLKRIIEATSVDEKNNIIKEIKF